MSKKNETKTSISGDDKYKDKAIRFYNKDDHYELVFTDSFCLPSSGTDFFDTAYTLITDIVQDLREADKSKELHILVSSFGGYVVGLNMVLEQVEEFEYRVGVNLGTACSCGFMLLAYCHELYTSPYAEWMYHEMSGGAFGKVDEIRNRSEYNIRWWQELIKNSNVRKILTPEEVELGKLSEVWLTGQELIDRKVALPYSLYNKRKTITPDTSNFFVIGEEVYRKESDGTFCKYTKSKNNGSNLKYFDLITKNNKIKN